MCGIAGAVWTAAEKALSPEILTRMTESIVHRGPDDSGTYFSDANASPERPSVGFGFRRLSIIDLAGGHQPLANEDETIWIVFNGEIYNDPELRPRLEQAGHRYRTNCDTETIVHLYEERGLDFVKELVGMFALAIWDSRRGEVILARDRLGQKPLFYAEQPDRLLFGSELKVLMQEPSVQRTLDPVAVDQYLAYRYIPPPRTILAGVKKLPPGHLGIFRQGKLSVQSYWNPTNQQEASLSLGEASEQLKTLMDTAVKIRLRSDVPLGAFLSGGIDSSITVGLAQRQITRKLKTFSIGFDIPEFDETSYAQEVAERIGTEHQEMRLGPSSVDILPKLAQHYDEPFGDYSAIPTWWLSEFTRQQVTVSVSGDGGDELFAGYPHHRSAGIAGWVDDLPPWLQSLAASRLWQQLPGVGKLNRVKTAARLFAQSRPERHFHWMSVFDDSLRPWLYSSEFAEQLGTAHPTDYLRRAYEQLADRDAVTQCSLVDLFTYLPGDLMTKVDIASMGNSLEVRCPFLDHRVVEFCVRLPSSLKLHQGVSKRLLREAFADVIPPSVLTRGKQGFGVPLGQWFRGPLKELLQQTLLDPQTLGRGIFQPQQIEQLVEDHLSEREDYTHQLWTLMMLEHWQQAWSAG